MLNTVGKVLVEAWVSTGLLVVCAPLLKFVA